jgi:hypothetical protein
LHCELEYSSLDHNPIYEALSYTWGDASIKLSILCGNNPFPVTSNLHEALLRLRSEKEARKVWIDAICINQDDIAERNAQVALMGDMSDIRGLLTNAANHLPTLSHNHLETLSQSL